jgi:hypothetical protein
MPEISVRFSPILKAQGGTVEYLKSKQRQWPFTTPSPPRLDFQRSFSVKTVVSIRLSPKKAIYQFASAWNSLPPVDALRESTRLGTPQNIYKKPNWKIKGLVVIGICDLFVSFCSLPVKGIPKGKKQSPKAACLRAGGKKTARILKGSYV